MSLLEVLLILLCLGFAVAAEGLGVGGARHALSLSTGKYHLTASSFARNISDFNQNNCTESKLADTWIKVTCKKYGSATHHIKSLS